MAPEVMLCSLGYLAGYDHRVDWYSLGICFYEMLVGRKPLEYSDHSSSRQVNKHLNNNANTSILIGIKIVESK